ncbi:MAG: C40 family peptidase [Desulfosporosinus sp.]|nr:C40 family peptidase [Desulfosporosinus sp.]
MILTSGLIGSTISTQASVKQQVLNTINSKSNVEIVRDKMNRINLVSAGNDLTKEAEDQTKNQENIALSEQPKTSDDLKKADGQVKPPDKKYTKKNDASISSNSKSISVPEKKTVSATKPNVSQQVSRGSSEVDKLISRARSLQGVPYLWGGTTRDGFDCSGFVQYVFKASGVSLPRTSFEQYKVGTPVSRDQLKPGDLVFFTTYKPGASDVRIYIGGGRTIGSASEGVGIHSLSDNYWSKRYIGARRVL